MSTSKPTRSPGPGSTRQMLDELDALMKRMLELPVNQLEDEPAPRENLEPVQQLHRFLALNSGDD